MPSETKRLRQLEEEKGKLQRIAANLSLDEAMLQNVVQKLAGLTASARRVSEDEQGRSKLSIVS